MMIIFTIAVVFCCVLAWREIYHAKFKKRLRVEALASSSLAHTQGRAEMKEGLSVDFDELQEKLQESRRLEMLSNEKAIRAKHEADRVLVFVDEVYVGLSRVLEKDHDTFRRAYPRVEELIHEEGNGEDRFEDSHSVSQDTTRPSNCLGYSSWLRPGFSAGGIHYPS